MKLRSTWYRATFDDGSRTSVSCCPDLGTVSLAWNRGYQDLFDWTEKGLRALLEKVFGKRVRRLEIG